jgi:hypothetical protein
MLSDRAGEAYGFVRDRPSAAGDLVEVIRAHRVSMLLDGNRVVDPESRGNAMQGVRKLLRALLDGGAISSASDVQIVLTKRDLIASADNSELLVQRIREFVDLLTRDFKSKVGRLTFWEIAARDPSGETPSGIETLMSDWLTKDTADVKRAPVSGPRASEFDRLLDRADLEYLP